jgi:hypothetical protein
VKQENGTQSSFYTFFHNDILLVMIATQDRLLATRRTRVVNDVHGFSRLYRTKKSESAGLICQYSWSWSTVRFYSGESDEDLRTLLRKRL